MEKCFRFLKTKINIVILIRKNLSTFSLREWPYQYSIVFYKFFRVIIQMWVSNVFIFHKQAYHNK